MNTLNVVAASGLAALLAFSNVAGAKNQDDAADLAALNEMKSGSNGKLGPWLSALRDEYQAATRGKASKKKAKNNFKSSLPLLRASKGRVAVEGLADDSAGLEAELEAMGATNVIRIGRLFSADVPISALDQLGNSASLRFVSPSMAKTRIASQGNVVGQGDLAINAPAARALDTGYDGTGVRVGIISDSFECDDIVFAPGAPNPRSDEDKANQDVDPNVVVLDNGECPGSDEGRGMANLIKDVAPGATQAFHTAFNSRLDFGLGILELGGIPTIFSQGIPDILPPLYPIIPPELRSDIIVDDIIYFVEPMFSPGLVAQSANLAAQSGIPYFSSAGNNARNSYEADFEPVTRYGNNGRKLQNGRTSGPNDSLRHDFDPGEGVDDTFTFGVIPDETGNAITVFSFQWNQPHVTSTSYGLALAGEFLTEPPAATSDVDLLFYNAKGILVPFCPLVGLATGITCQITGINNIGGDAVELAALIYKGPVTKGPQLFQASVVVSGGDAPDRIKWVPFDITGTMVPLEYPTEAGTAYGHSNGEHVASVAAAAFYFTQAFDGDAAILPRIPVGACTATSAACLEDFSSAGEIALYHDALGNPITPLVPDNPRFTGVDGSNTSFFAFDSSFDDDDSDGRNSPFSTFVTPVLDEVGDETPNFFGTSASAPNVAAVAALMLQKNPGLTPDLVYQILSDTAQPVSLREDGYDELPPGYLITKTIPDEPERPGFNYDSGHGLVDAEAAVMAVPAAP